MNEFYRLGEARRTPLPIPLEGDKGGVLLMGSLRFNPSYSIVV